VVKGKQGSYKNPEEFEAAKEQVNKYMQRLRKEKTINLTAYKKVKDFLERKCLGMFAVFVEGRLVVLGKDREQVCRQASKMSFILKITSHSLLVEVGKDEGRIISRWSFL